MTHSPVTRESPTEVSVQKNDEKRCARCLNGKQARYRVYTDTMDIAVCAACAGEARRLGISVEQLDGTVERS
jgi:predicted metal-binding protein